jgi:predicted alpha/beta hydrolase
LIGLAANNTRLRQLVTIAAQNAYWGHWKAPRKYGMALLWNCIVPLSSHLYGCFPGSKLGMVNDVPKGVALEWASWCRSPHYFFDSSRTSVNNFSNLHVPLTAYSFDDDWYAGMHPVKP